MSATAEQTATEEFLDSIPTEQDLATDLSKAIAEVALYLTLLGDGEVDEQAILDGLEDDEAREKLETWVGDVLATVENGGDLRDNGGTLLTVPDCLTHLFTPQTHADASVSDSGRPEFSETREEAKARLESEMHALRQEWSEAVLKKDQNKASYDSAKKNEEEVRGRLLFKLGELDDINHGGEWQRRLPLERGTEEREPVSTETDQAIAMSVGVLTEEQLAEKTNGQCGDAGIPTGTADLLVDAGLGTIGLLEAHMRKHKEFWAKEIKGIGPAKAEKILEALGELRKVYPQVGDGE